MGYPTGPAAYGAVAHHMHPSSGVGAGPRSSAQDAELMAEYARQRAAAAAAAAPPRGPLPPAPGPVPVSHGNSSNGHGGGVGAASEADAHASRSRGHSSGAGYTAGREHRRESAEISDQGDSEEGLDEGSAPLAMRRTRRDGRRVAQRRASHNAIELRRSRRIQQAIKELQDLLEVRAVGGPWAPVGHLVRHRAPAGRGRGQEARQGVHPRHHGGVHPSRAGGEERSRQVTCVAAGVQRPDGMQPADPEYSAFAPCDPSCVDRIRRLLSPVLSVGNGACDGRRGGGAARGAWAAKQRAGEIRVCPPAHLPAPPRPARPRAEGVPLGISYETIFQFAAVPIAIADAGGKLRDANRMFYHLFLSNPYGTLPPSDSPARMIFHDSEAGEREKGLRCGAAPCMRLPAARSAQGSAPLTAALPSPAAARSMMQSLAHSSAATPGASVVVVSKRTRFGVDARFRVSLAPITEAATASRVGRSASGTTDAEADGDDALSSIKTESATDPSADMPADTPHLLYCVFHPLEKEEELWRKAFGDESILRVDASGNVVPDSVGAAAATAAGPASGSASGSASGRAQGSDAGDTVPPESPQSAAGSAAPTAAAASDAASRPRASPTRRRRRARAPGADSGAAEEAEEAEEAGTQQEAAVVSNASGTAPAKRARHE